MVDLYKSSIVTSAVEYQIEIGLGLSNKPSKTHRWKENWLSNLLNIKLTNTNFYELET